LKPAIINKQNNVLYSKLPENDVLFQYNINQILNQITYKFILAFAVFSADLILLSFSHLTNKYSIFLLLALKMTLISIQITLFSIKVGDSNLSGLQTIAVTIILALIITQINLISCSILNAASNNKSLNSALF
jgi:hypothetical protein